MVKNVNSHITMYKYIYDLNKNTLKDTRTE